MALEPQNQLAIDASFSLRTLDSQKIALINLPKKALDRDAAGTGIAGAAFKKDEVLPRAAFNKHAAAELRRARRPARRAAGAGLGITTINMAS